MQTLKKDESWIIQWAGLDAATEIAEANIVHKCVKKIGRMSAYYTSSPDNFCCAVSGPLQPVEVAQCLSKLLGNTSDKVKKKFIDLLRLVRSALRPMSLPRRTRRSRLRWCARALYVSSKPWQHAQAGSNTSQSVIQDEMNKVVKALGMSELEIAEYL